MYYYHSDFHQSVSLPESSTVAIVASIATMSSQVEDEDALRLPDLAQGTTKDAESEMRQWLAERRAKRRSSDETSPIDGNRLLPMGRDSLPLDAVAPSVSPIYASASPASDRSGDTNERMERWLKSRKSVRMDMTNLRGPLDILSRITSPIKSTDEKDSESTQESFVMKSENTDSSNGLLVPRPPTDEAPSASTTPTRTSIAQFHLKSPSGGQDTNKDITKDTVSAVERPRSFYREYVEHQKKREQQTAAEKEPAEHETAARSPSQEVGDTMTSDFLNAIPEDEEEDSDEDEVYDTGAAVSALLRMQEMHEEMQSKDNKTGRKNSKSVNKTSGYSAKRGSQLRKNSEARNPGAEEIVCGDSRSGSESRKNSRAQNSIGIFGSRKNSNKPAATPARSQRTVMKRFTDGKTELDQKLSEKELAAREQLQARLEKRNKQMAEAALKRRQSEKGWK